MYNGTIFMIIIVEIMCNLSEFIRNYKENVKIVSWMNKSDEK